MVEYTVAHLIAYALTMPNGIERARFTARVLNTADEISLSKPKPLEKTQMQTIFSFDVSAKHTFETSPQATKKAPQVLLNQLMACLDHADENPLDLKIGIYQAFHEGRTKDFTVKLKEFARINGVYIAERVRFVP